MSDGVISKIQLPNNNIYDVVDSTSGYITGMTILSYGHSTWNDFLAAYNANKVVYCRASSNSNPASGSQTRLAFMAYVDNGTSPTNVEFQYYRSVSSHSDSQQGDQMYVYKLTSSNSWTVTVRESYTKMVAGSGLKSTYSSGKLTLALDTAYGDTVNPYAEKTANYVLAGPTSGSNAVPSFRALVSDDIPDLSSIYLTSYTETDPTVPSWAKESTKPSYNFSEIGSTPTTLSGYGITDASISSGVITLGNDTITPLTSNSTLNAAKLSGAIPSGVTATTQSASDNSTKIATTAYVTTAISNLPTPMTFKGSVGTNGTITSLPAASSSNEGYTYKVITDLSTPVVAKIGDTVISNGSTWIVIPSGDEPSGTVTSVGLSNATNGGLTISDSPITSSGSITVGHSNVLTSAQTTQAVYPIKIDKNGHISAYGSAVSIPTKVSDLTNDSGYVTTDTKDTAGSKQPVGSRQKLYLIGASYQSAHAETYSYSDTYIDSDGSFHVNGALAIGNGDNSYCNVFAPIEVPTAHRVYGLPNKAGTIALTSDIPSVPSSAASATTGISISDHGTTSVGSASNWSAGTASTWAFEEVSIPNVTNAGSASSWTFEEKSIPNVTAAGSASSWTFEEKTIPNVTAAGSGSASLTFTMDTTDTKKLKIAFSHSHTAPTLGTAIKVQSKSGGSNGTAPTLGTAIKVQSKSGGSNGAAPTLGTAIKVQSKKSGSNSTVPSLTVTSTTVVNGKTHTVTDTGHTHTLS